jgi:hypothetical protein
MAHGFQKNSIFCAAFNDEAIARDDLLILFIIL